MSKSFKVSCLNLDTDEVLTGCVLLEGREVVTCHFEDEVFSDGADVVFWLGAYLDGDETDRLEFTLTQIQI